MDIKKIRKNIDKIDSDIVKMLNSRMELSMMTKRFKDNIEDSSREEEIYLAIKQKANKLISEDFLKSLYADILKQSKDNQKQNLSLIAFQGEHGAYSEVAAKYWNESILAIPCSVFADVFEGVSSGAYEYGIVPIENTTGGVVGEVNRLLIKTELKVIGAIDLPVHHCLLALSEADHREIRDVYSHTQALSQCRNFLQRNKLEPIPYYDTAGAAKMIVDKQMFFSAAIASKLSAEIYGLEILKEDVQDSDSNTTRFLVLAKEALKEEGNKCSIVFTTEHKSGTLFKVLEIFAKDSINLTRIESMPNDPYDFVFFLDFIGSDRDEKIKKALKKVEEVAGYYRFMGCYNERKAN